MSDFLFVSLREGDMGPRIAESELTDVIESTGLRREDIDHQIISTVNDAIGDLNGYKGIIAGGSSLNVTNTFYSDYQHHVHRQLSTLMNADVPVLFICFGAGWLAAESGGRVDNLHPEQTGATQVELLEAAYSDPLCVDIPTTFTGLTGHREAVASVGSDVTVLASGPTCPYQLIRYKDNVWAAQFHPEMGAKGLEVRMRFYINDGYFSPEDFDTIVASLENYDTSHAHQILRNFIDYSRQLANGS